MSPPADFEQQIRERAYHLWLAAGAAHGCAHEHWLAAERAVLNAAPIRVAALGKARARKAPAPLAAKPVHAAKPKRAAPKRPAAAPKAARAAAKHDLGASLGA